MHGPSPRARCVRRWILSAIAIGALWLVPSELRTLIGHPALAQAVGTTYFVDCLTEGRRPEVVTPQTSRQSLATTLREIEMIKAQASNV